MSINEKKLGLLPLVLLIFGCTLATGVFAIPGDAANAGSYGLGNIIGWGITLIGMLGLVGCYMRITAVRGDLTSGIYTYAKEGFGSYIGFNSAWGYWISALLAYVTYSTGIIGSLKEVFPIFQNNFISLILCSAVLWLLVLLLLKGVNEAIILNAIAVIFKIIPIVFLLLAIVFAGAFKWDIFVNNLFGPSSAMSIFDQSKACIFITLWSFIGIEVAVVISARAKNTKMSGTATLISFLSLFALYFLISFLTLGVADHDTLVYFSQNYNFSMAGAMEYIVGPWGGYLVNISAIISMGVSMLSWFILCADSASGPAENGCFPKVFLKKNKFGQAKFSIIFSAVLLQFFVILALFSESKFNVCYKLSTVGIMIPYMLSAFFCLKITFTGELSKGTKKTGNIFVWLTAIIGSIYGVWMLYASSVQYILLCALMYLPGFILYYIKRKEDGKTKIFPKIYDLLVFLLLVILTIIAIYLLSNNLISIS